MKNESHCIPLEQSQYISPIMKDYLNQSADLKPFYNRFPSFDNFQEQIKEKSAHFRSHQREVLVDYLRDAYQHLPKDEHDLVFEHIEALSSDQTFTVCTGHQLNLFTGPVYFWYKILNTIKLAEELTKRNPNHKIVPVYWMASEDHDFEEINHFIYRESKYAWERSFGQAVGMLSMDGASEVLKVFKEDLGNGKQAKILEDWIDNYYLQGEDLSIATFNLVNRLFKDYGLIIIDAKHKDLKRSFIPILKKELIENLSNRAVLNSIDALSKTYKIQVNPREINLFYMDDSGRYRIERQGKGFSLVGSDKSWTENELIAELDAFPERFSPNVVMRPVYQEFLLPNLCYIGGGGELAYWLELKKAFEAYDQVFPILMLRNSLIQMEDRIFDKLRKLEVTMQQFALKKVNLSREMTKQYSEIPIDFNPQRKILENQFKDLWKIASETDRSFENAVKAQEKKQLKGLDMLEKRLLKAQKRKYEDRLNRLGDLKDIYFPNDGLAERQVNFSQYFMDFGEQFLERSYKDMPALGGHLCFIAQD